jgi:hypothetical protein
MFSNNNILQLKILFFENSSQEDDKHYKWHLKIIKSDVQWLIKKLV